MNKNVFISVKNKPIQDIPSWGKEHTKISNPNEKKAETLMRIKDKGRIRSAVAAILAVAALYFFFHLTGIGCPIKFLTGISCPGCGMTRAVISLMTLRFADAWYYHPLVYLLPACIIVFLLKSRIPKKIFRTLVFTTIVLYVTIYITRLLDPLSEIVTFHPEQGFVYRTIKYLFF